MWGIPVPSQVPKSGSGWGMTVRSGSGIPSDALGNLGDRYFDTTAQRWYLKRWVGNREGSGDGILFPVNLFPSVGNFDFSMLVRRDNVPDGQLIFAASSPDIFSAFNFRLDVGVQAHSVSLRSSAGASQYFLSSPSTDTQWHKLGCGRVGSALYISTDNNVNSIVADTSSWSPSLTQSGTRVLSTTNSASLSIKACNVKLTAPGGAITAALDDGAGSMISNATGPNGTLTDASPTNFWYVSWVPMDLL